MCDKGYTVMFSVSDWHLENTIVDYANSDFKPTKEEPINPEKLWK